MVTFQFIRNVGGFWSSSSSSWDIRLRDIMSFVVMPTDIPILGYGYLLDLGDSTEVLIVLDGACCKPLLQVKETIFRLCGLYLVKMMSEYIDMNNCLPMLSVEVVHRVAEILKTFNSRTSSCSWSKCLTGVRIEIYYCQTLGYGKSSASHMPLFLLKMFETNGLIFSWLFQEIKRVLLLRVPETYEGLLQLEIDRVAIVREF
ncbi:hypothetical protein Pfo_012540 [Paulownia fortunei]|nr:hypothetical protein Pfo_012540 [Paulownia fortunei]